MVVLKIMEDNECAQHTVGPEEAHSRSCGSAGPHAVSSEVRSDPASPAWPLFILDDS